MPMNYISFFWILLQFCFCFLHCRNGVLFFSVRQFRSLRISKVHATAAAKPGIRIDKSSADIAFFNHRKKEGRNGSLEFCITK